MPGLQAASALGLPGPRQSIGLEVQGNAYSVLLPYSVCAPCSATQVFTTVHDGQAQVGYSVSLLAQSPPIQPQPPSKLYYHLGEIFAWAICL